MLELVKREFGFSYTMPGMWRLLERLGFELSREHGWKLATTVGARSQAQRISRGRPTPWGFRREDDGRLVPVPVEQRAAVIARHMHVSGFSITEIANLLRDAGIHGRDGKPIPRRLVAELIAPHRGSRGQA